MSLPAHVSSGSGKAVCLLALLLLVTAPGTAFAQDAPATLTAAAGNGQITLAWTTDNFPAAFPTFTSPAAEFYRVYRATTPGGENAQPVAQVDDPNFGDDSDDDTPVPLASYTDPNVTAGVTYYYRVTAVLETFNSGRPHQDDPPPLYVTESAMSPEASAASWRSVPAPPTGLTAAAGATQVALSWNASDGATSYNLYRGTSPGAEDATPLQTGLTDTHFVDATGTAAHSYQITAVNMGGESAVSDEAPLVGPRLAFNPADWVVQDENGVTIPSSSSAYQLHPSQTGTFTDTYPPGPTTLDVLPVDGRSICAGGWLYYLLADNIGPNRNGFWSQLDGSLLPWNGSQSVDIKGHLEADWVYIGPPPAPPYVDIQATTQQEADATADYGLSLVFSGVSATATANDGLGGVITATAAPHLTLLPYSFGDAVYLPLQSYYHWRVPVVGGKARVVVNGHVSGTASDGIAYGDYIGYNASTPTNGGTVATSDSTLAGTMQHDDRAVTISADVDTTSKKVPLLDAAGNQTTDANGDPNYTTASNAADLNGTMHGDTIYSYHFYTDYTQNSGDGGGSVYDALLWNWIDFHPNYTGNWHYKQGITHNGDSVIVPNVVAPDTWSWSPNESEDTWDYGKCSMPWATNYSETDTTGPTGQDAPQEYDVQYSATDNTDGANAIAKYIMTVHDPYEHNYPDHTAYVLNHFRPVPGPAYSRASYDNEALTVNVTNGDSWTVTGSINCPLAMAKWVASAIGLTFQVSRQYSFSAGVVQTVTSPYSYHGQTYTVHEGDETYMEEFDQYVRHYGKVDTWGVSGYSGAQPYDFLLPDNPSGGYQAHLPLIQTITGR